MSYQPTAQRTTSTLAVLSLVFGIAGWTLLPLIGSIVAIVCGHMARGEIRRAQPGSVDGDGLAVAGLVLGYAQVAFALACTVFVIVLLVFGFGFGASLLHNLPH
ncbi:DUF4190 domain-containing protein [Dyella telluris]|uniref:DUF4190 domain-containing protein n=1 Tax=Dyella telluris TaxID=2763498 RepID=A0A7G8Q1X5_9GAMM|nr:DUF4190 domain-containing protein [Dyella telluris]QNK00783.1 DUF4190 domain-containing protein [Dyella telluris]